MKIHQITTSIYEENCYVAETGEHTCVLVDPGAGMEEIGRLCREKSLTVQAILLTHGHVDHVYHARRLRDAYGVPVCMHRADVCMVREDAPPFPGVMPLPAKERFSPDRLLTEGDVLTFGSWSCTVLETPGHSMGSCCFLAGDVLFTGDTLFRGSIGRTDLAGGDAAAIARSLRRLAQLPEDLTVCPGHGGTTTVGYEKRNNLFLCDRSPLWRCD